MNFRSRSLLDSIHHLPCTLEIPGVCEGGHGEPAHANWAEYGKGAGIKAHDVFVASACRACHHELDHGKRLSHDERKAIWERGFRKTLVLLWQLGQIGVSAGQGGQSSADRCAPRAMPAAGFPKRTSKRSATASPAKCLPRT